MTRKKNLLFISSYPFPLGKGSNQHAYFFLKALSQQFNVYCIFFVQPGVESHLASLKDLEPLGIKKYECCFYADRQVQNRGREAIKRSFSFPSYYINRATHSDGIQIINEYIKQYAIDIVHIEQAHYFKYALFFNRAVKKVIVYSDLYHMVSWRQIRYETSYHAKLQLIFAALKMYVFERQLESRIDCKIFLNPEEMQGLPKKAVHIPHIVNPEIKYIEPESGEVFNILFMGGYNHPPNRVSVRYIIDHVVPVLSSKCRDFAFHIVGSGMEKFGEVVERSVLKDRFRIRGFERDINGVFKGMDIAFFPILYGGGIKTKVIEAMAAGVPVVTTPDGVAGLSDLPDGCVGVGKTLDELVDELLELMRSHELRLERSRAGREYVDRFHSFDELLIRVSNTYQAL